MMSMEVEQVVIYGLLNMYEKYLTPDDLLRSKVEVRP